MIHLIPFPMSRTSFLSVPFNASSIFVGSIPDSSIFTERTAFGSAFLIASASLSQSTVSFAADVTVFSAVSAVVSSVFDVSPFFTSSAFDVSSFFTSSAFDVSSFFASSAFDVSSFFTSSAFDVSSFFSSSVFDVSSFFSSSATISFLTSTM